MNDIAATIATTGINKNRYEKAFESHFAIMDVKIISVKNAAKPHMTIEILAKYFLIKPP
ncbi:hypothetical protein KAM398_02420 [Acinetobacter sp. KAM398]|uniref:hypothetical protein n=1 Tax=Acinetobacter sp. KAM392 TaxID=2799591 RepID=UPI001F29EEE3|nr:hypothetical protein [Acinetobacter sp. KAM392]GJC33073.1 hypothetical protein KAM393_02420 [Acinetobacter sp. KAM393]GJC35902.1 hypothetical protein KAM394_02420 [Acinetobacter sp. KAM394]GJC38523.1 hypothetical protein KAM395_00440 [Acinetobacter sp. KAM395]GJC41348.1 hypothetical protein KAM396_00450 [Acinetobacter sp. KAM396]GJC44362.1 hypothetical protein KAM397_02420 [Acinetobacter sp. KAM397]GJC47190.1 hypothetical protein KAM398_02420 [Acinetobacter sp. KAM398]GJC50109.1 hypotheti